MNRKIVKLLIQFRLTFIANIITYYTSKYRRSFPVTNRGGFWRYDMGDKIIFDELLNYNVSKKSIDFVMHEVYFKHYSPQLGDTCVDIGAGIGTESVELSRRIGPSGRIHAIEAMGSTVQVLKKNLKANDCSNVDVHHLAISNNSDPVFIEEDEDHIKNRLSSESSGKGTAVSASTIDEFLENQKIDSIDFLKVNIEGAEQLMIEQFSRILDVKNVAISCHDFLGKRQNNPWLFTKDKVISFLNKSGFELKFNNTGVPFADDWVFATNPRFRRSEK